MTTSCRYRCWYRASTASTSIRSMASRWSCCAWRESTAVITTVGAARPPPTARMHEARLERLHEHQREIVCRHAHDLLALQSVQGGGARHFLELAQAPRLVAPLERGIEIEVGRHGRALLQEGAVEHQLAAGAQVTRGAEA